MRRGAFRKCGSHTVVGKKSVSVLYVFVSEITKNLWSLWNFQGKNLLGKGPKPVRNCVESTILVGGGVPELCGKQLFWGLQISPKSILAPLSLSHKSFIRLSIFPGRTCYWCSVALLQKMGCCRVGWFSDVFNCVVNGHMYDVSEFGHHRDFKLEEHEMFEKCEHGMFRTQSRGVMWVVARKFWWVRWLWIGIYRLV